MGKPQTDVDDDSIDAVSTRAVYRMFAVRFPGVTLEHFGARRKGPTFLVSTHFLTMVGATRQLLDLALIREDMIPPGRKRIAHGDFDTKRRGTVHGSRWDISRLKGNRLRARFDIMGDDEEGLSRPMGTYVDDLPADHPLQMFHPRHWPFGDAREQRHYFESTRAAARSWIDRHLTELRTNVGQMTSHGYSVRLADRDRMWHMVRQFSDELLEAFDNAGVESEKAPQLRMVVNNAAAVPHG
jgi:hypothetical protein